MGIWNFYSRLKTRNGCISQATGRILSCSASGLNLASNLSGDTTMPTVPDESTTSNRNKCTRHMKREVLHCYYHTLLSCKLSGFRKLVHQLWCGYLFQLMFVLVCRCRHWIHFLTRQLTFWWTCPCCQFCIT